MKLLVLTFASFAIALAQTGANETIEPTVDSCQICDYVINQATRHFDKGFTEDKLQQELIYDCQSLQRFYGPQTVQDCLDTVNQNIDTIYSDLKAGKAGHEICIDIGKCSPPATSAMPPPRRHH